MTAAATDAPAIRPTEPRPWRTTVEAYYQLAELGFFGDARVELLEGEIVEMPSQLDPHRWGVSKATAAAYAAYADESRFSVFPNGTLRLGRWSAPDPDLCVVECPLGTPWDQEPPPLWVLEVSATTYRLDSTRKLRIYARAGISDYWILNLNARRLEVHRGPAKIGGEWTYRDVAHLGPGESVTTINGPAVTFAVDRLLPPQAESAAHSPA